MLDKDGGLSFAGELMDVVSRFLDEYQETSGPFHDKLEKGLVISYALGLMRCDLEAIWDCLGENDVFGALHPRVVFENCAADEDADNQQLCVEIRQRLCDCGWLADVEAER